MPGVSIVRVDHDDGAFRVALADEVVTADKVLVAAGRSANLPDLGLDSVGVDGDVRFLDTDGRMRVRGGDGQTVPWLYAVGDVVGKGTVHAHREVPGRRRAAHPARARTAPDADFRAVPRVTFTDPEVGSVGLTEAQAREQGGRIRTSVLPLSDSTRADVHGPGRRGAGQARRGR